MNVTTQNILSHYFDAIISIYIRAEFIENIISKNTVYGMI